jgi:hypothetical protein
MAEFEIAQKPQQCSRAMMTSRLFQPVLARFAELQREQDAR